MIICFSVLLSLSKRWRSASSSWGGFSITHPCYLHFWLSKCPHTPHTPDSGKRRVDHLKVIDTWWICNHFQPSETTSDHGRSCVQCLHTCEVTHKGPSAKSPLCRRPRAATHMDGGRAGFFFPIKWSPWNFPACILIFLTCLVNIWLIFGNIWSMFVQQVSVQVYMSPIDPTSA